MFTVRATEEQDSYETGAVRSDQTGKSRPDLVPGVCMLRLGEHYQKGAALYGERNYEKGIPSSRGLASLQRHLEQYKTGDREEDHLSAIAFNALMLIFNEEMAGKHHFPNDQEILDLPWYQY